jgi:fructose-bisphosphate aldolase class 1
MNIVSGSRLLAIRESIFRSSRRPSDQGISKKVRAKAKISAQIKIKIISPILI